MCVDYLTKVFLFKNVDKNTLTEIINDKFYSVIEYQRSKTLFTSSHFEKGIYFILDGKCEILSMHDTKAVVINTLAKYDSFGALTLFGKEKEYPTEIKAVKKTRVIFFSKETVLHLLEKYSLISRNLFEFLTERIYFLNSKISSFTKGSVEAKLALYLLEQYKKNNSTDVKLNFKKCSEILGNGRASVYRAIATLTEKGCILVEDKIITIIDIKKLEDISK